MSRSRNTSRISSSSNAGKRRFNPSVMALALAGALAVPGTASAAGWLGFVSSDWFNAGNWSTAVVPTAADGVLIDAPKTAIVNVGAASTFDLQIGVGAAGALAIVNGGSVTSGYANLANTAGSAGTVLVDGVGSSLRLNGLGTLRVGGAGTGTVLISNGGTVSNSMLGQIGVGSGSSGNGHHPGFGLNLEQRDAVGGQFRHGETQPHYWGHSQQRERHTGRRRNGVGTVTVDGAGSAWNNSGNLTVGGNGNGTLVVLNGGTLNIAQDTQLPQRQTPSARCLWMVWDLNGSIVALSMWDWVAQAP